MNCIQQHCVVGLSALMLAIGLAGPAEAGLSDIGGGIIFDDDTNLSWLQNMNTGASNQFGLTQSADVMPAAGEIGVSGHMSWFTANVWIFQMNTAAYLGFTDWRLPTTTQPDASCSAQNAFGGSVLQGFSSDCTGSEMGHLFNVEMVTFAAPGLFSNVQAARYWSGTDFAPISLPGQAWQFNFFNGDQFSITKDFNGNIHASAVRSGGSAPIIPEPATVLLFGTGLAGLVAWRMRKGRA